MKLCTRYVTAVISLVVIMANTVHSQLVSFTSDPCPTPAVVQNFNIPNYMGKWYLNRKYSQYNTWWPPKCVTATYTAQANNLFGVTNSVVYVRPWYINFYGQAKLANPASTEAKLTFALSTTAFTSNPTAVTPSNYWVLATDYTKYAVAYVCYKIFDLRTEYLWVLTRDRQPAQSVVAAALAAMQSKNLDVAKLRVIEQNSCPN